MSAIVRRSVTIIGDRDWSNDMTIRDVVTALTEELALAPQSDAKRLSLVEGQDRYGGLKLTAKLTLERRSKLVVPAE